MIENLKDVSYSDRLCIIGMPTLQFRRFRTDMIQVYKIINGYEDVEMECYFTVDSDSYTRRHLFKLKKIRGNTVRHISIFSHCTVDDWNSLPSSVVLSNLVNCLKSRLNDAWKEHPLKFVADCFWFSCGPIPILLKILLRRGGVTQVFDLFYLNKGEHASTSQRTSMSPLSQLLR